MKKIKNLLPYFFLFFVFIMVIFSLRSNPFSTVLNEHDSSMFLYFGKGMTEGLIPYKDMLDHKGPVLFIIQLFAALIGNGNISFGIWILECLFLFITIVFLYKNCFLYVESRIISAVAIIFLTPLFICCFDGGNYSEEFALSFISVSFFLFSKIALQDEISKTGYFFIGFFGAATFFIRVNMISLWVVFCLFLVFQGIKNQKMRILIQQIKNIFLGGFFLTAIVILISLIQHNLREMFQQAFLMNILYSNSNFYEKLQSSFSFIDLLLKTGIFPILVIYFISLFNKQSIIPKNVHWILIIYFIFNFITVILSGRYYTHYLITQFAPISVFLAIAIRFILRSIKKNKARLISLILLLTIIVPSTSIAFRTYNYRFNNSIFPGDEELRGFSKYINENSLKKDKIYVHNIDANVYLLSDRYSNSRFFVLPAVNYNDFPKLRGEFNKDFNTHPPKYVVVRKCFFEDAENTSNLNDIVFKELENKYHEIKPVKAENYSLFKLN